MSPKSSSSKSRQRKRRRRELKSKKRQFLIDAQTRSMNQFHDPNLSSSPMQNSNKTSSAREQQSSSRKKNKKDKTKKQRSPKTSPKKAVLRTRAKDPKKGDYYGKPFGNRQTRFKIRISRRTSVVVNKKTMSLRLDIFPVITAIYRHILNVAQVRV